MFDDCITPDWWHDPVLLALDFTPVLECLDRLLRRGRPSGCLALLPHVRMHATALRRDPVGHRPLDAWRHRLSVSPVWHARGFHYARARHLTAA
jgi:hypothetical protein